MSPKVLRSFLCGRGIHVTSLIMSNCHVVTHEVFAQLGNSCPKLQELNLSNCHTLDVNSLVYPENMRQLKSLNLYRTNILTTELKRILVNNNLLESLNIGEQLIEELVTVATRVNYGQMPGNVHAFVGSVGLALL